MMWDVSEEHEVCYKDKDVLKKVNDLTDLFDDVIAYLFNSFDRCEFYVDVFYTDTQDVGQGMHEQLVKYTDMFIDNDYIKKCVEKSKNDSFECAYICSGNLLELLTQPFDMSFNKKKILDNENVYDLLKKLADKLCKALGTANAALYKVKKTPCLFDEFYALIFISHCIRCGNYTFLIMYGTSE